MTVLKEQTSEICALTVGNRAGHQCYCKASLCVRSSGYNVSIDHQPQQADAEPLQMSVYGLLFSVDW